MADYNNTMNRPISPAASAGGYAGPNSQKFLGTMLAKLPFSYSFLSRMYDSNPYFETFYKTGTNRDDKIASRSVFYGDRSTTGSMLVDKSYHDFIYAKADTNKIRRIQDYRRMASYYVVSDALDEICDECIAEDSKGNVVNCAIEGSYNEQTKQELLKEWEKFANLFNLKEKGYNYFRQWLIDSELFFENIIDSKKPEKGIIGVILLPPELINPVYDNLQNELIREFLLRKPAPVMTNTQQEESVLMNKNQVTYINSGIWNEDKTIRMPYIENCRKAYKQLSLLEDTFILYRLTRAPQRLVFNVEMGNMDTPKMEAYLKRLMQQLWSRRSYSHKEGQVTNAYDTHNMLEAYFFAKRNGQGTEVTNLDTNSSLGNMEDLLHFKKNLYNALKVPIGRLDPSTMTGGAGGADVTREELRFAKFIIRLQRQFAQGMKNAFITHLRLREMWKKYNLKENSIIIKFNTPTNFQEMRDNQLFEMKQNQFNQLTQNPSISPTYAQKHHLKWSDQDIKENRAWVRKDAEFMWEIEKIKAEGPNFREQGAELDSAIQELQGGGGSTTSALEQPPEFGTAPEPAPGTALATPETPEAPESTPPLAPSVT
jgi:hypothetical protein